MMQKTINATTLFILGSRFILSIYDDGGVYAFTTTATFGNRHAPSKITLSSTRGDDMLNFLSDGDDDNDEDESRLEQKKLGIQIGKSLQPLTAEQEQEVIDEATVIINESFEAEKEKFKNLKEKTKREFEDAKDKLNYQSNLRTELETGKMLDKIDAMSSKFLEETRWSRMGTRMASMADQAMVGKGLEMGSWGSIGGNAVVASGDGNVGVLGSSSSDDSVRSTTDDVEGDVAEQNNRILIIFDKNEVSLWDK